jgi:hypothetical protein
VTEAVISAAFSGDLLSCGPWRSEMVVSVRSCAILPTGAALGADQRHGRSAACPLAAVRSGRKKLALSAWEVVNGSPLTGSPAG